MSWAFFLETIPSSISTPPLRNRLMGSSPFRYPSHRRCVLAAAIFPDKTIITQSLTTITTWRYARRWSGPSYIIFSTSHKHYGVSFSRRHRFLSSSISPQLPKARPNRVPDDAAASPHRPPPLAAPISGVRRSSHDVRSGSPRPALRLLRLDETLPNRQRNVFRCVGQLRDLRFMSPVVLILGNAVPWLIKDVAYPSLSVHSPSSHFGSAERLPALYFTRGSLTASRLRELRLRELLVHDWSILVTRKKHRTMSLSTSHSLGTTPSG
ncbi:hypothetical protein C8F01DRAFT_1250077 [Mycena amicta]|nr:hypothetical protein C8F01DRAFT_1250077 [Mycena amicta]